MDEQGSTELRPFLTKRSRAVLGLSNTHPGRWRSAKPRPSLRVYLIVSCCVIPCCVVLCCIVLCHVVLCHSVLCYAVLCCIVLCCVVLYCAVFRAVLCCAVLFYIMLCCVMPCRTVLCYVVLYHLVSYYVFCCVVLCCVVLSHVVSCCVMLYSIVLCAIVLCCVVLYFSVGRDRRTKFRLTYTQIVPPHRHPLCFLSGQSDMNSPNPQKTKKRSPMANLTALTHGLMHITSILAPRL